MNRSLLLRTAILTFLIVIGFWFHTSTENASILGKYSINYFVFLCGISGVTFVVNLYLMKLISTSSVSLPSGNVWNISSSFKLCVLLIAGLSTCIGAEIAIRIVRPRESDEQRESKINQLHAHLDTWNPRNSEEFHNNSWGFRSEPIALKKPENHFRIFIVGGSTVYCKEVSYEESYCNLIRLDLEDNQSDTIYEVQNAGCGWHCSLHSLLKIQTLIEPFQPDLIVVYHGINDLYRSFEMDGFALRDFEHDYGHYIGPLSGLVENYRTAGDVNLRSWQAASSLFEKQWFSDFRKREEFRPVSEISVDEWQSLDSFRRNMTNIVRYAKSMNIKLLLCTQPSLYKLEMTDQERATIIYPSWFCEVDRKIPDIPSMLAGMQEFNSSIKQIAGQHEVPLLDLDAEIPKTLEYFVDDVHYTSAGNAFIAELMLRKFQENQLLP